MTKYQPTNTNNSLLVLCGLTLYCIAIVVLILVLCNGCSNPVAPTVNDNLTIQRSCQDCHLLQIKPVRRNEL